MSRRGAGGGRRLAWGRKGVWVRSCDRGSDTTELDLRPAVSTPRSPHPHRSSSWSLERPPRPRRLSCSLNRPPRPMFRSRQVSGPHSPRLSSPVPCSGPGRSLVRPSPRFSSPVPRFSSPDPSAGPGRSLVRPCPHRQPQCRSSASPQFRSAQWPCSPFEFPLPIDVVTTASSNSHYH